MQAKQGIYGGSFDPPHNAHLMVARRVMNQLALQGVVFMPLGQPPHKDAGMTQARHRLAMTRLLVENEAGMSVSQAEVQREQTSYTVETLRRYSAENPHTQPVFIMGGDSLVSFRQWYRYREILRLAQLAVVTRPGNSAKQHADAARMLRDMGGVVHLLEGEEMDIASSDIRKRVRAGEDITGMVPQAVAQYIARQGLYRESNEEPTGNY